MTKPTKWPVCPAKTQISLGIHSLIRVFAVRTKKHWTLNYLLSAQCRLIRLGGCTGWSESSLGAHIICWFCHAAIHSIVRSPGTAIIKGRILPLSPRGRVEKRETTKYGHTSRRSAQRQLHLPLVKWLFRKLILQTRMRSHPVGLDVLFLGGPFVYFYTSCVRTAKTLETLR